MDPERRDLLKAGSLMLVSLAAMTRAVHSHAQAKALPHLADANKVDRQKFPAYKPGTDCDDCIQFEGKKKEAFGPCKIFPGKAVSAKGWCSAFQPKKA
jgi:hypothetical protein